MDMGMNVTSATSGSENKSKSPAKSSLVHRNRPETIHEEAESDDEERAGLLADTRFSPMPPNCQENRLFLPEPALNRGQSLAMGEEYAANRRPRQQQHHLGSRRDQEKVRRCRCRFKRLKTFVAVTVCLCILYMSRFFQTN